MVSRDNKRLLAILIALTTLTVLAVFSSGQSNEPSGLDDLNFTETSRFTPRPAKSTVAQAGNVTELNVGVRAMTKAWQGYYGNISGTITLENSNGDQFYNWQALEPEGEIFASTNSSITWSNISCFNFYGGPVGNINVTTEELRYGINDTDVDGINETYTATNHPVFFVGTTQLSGCPTAYPFQSNSSQTTNFPNALLEVEIENTLIFTAILENRDAANETDKLGFDGTPTDFQLFVAEDEHSAPAEGATTYFFWAEIE